jgi:hypothetical protein
MLNSQGDFPTPMTSNFVAVRARLNQHIPTKGVLRTIDLECDMGPTEEWVWLVTYGVKQQSRIRKAITTIETAFTGRIKEHVLQVNFKTRECYKIKVLQHCLTTLITERVLSRRIDETANQFTETMGEPDPAFDGLWLTTDQEKSQQFLDKIGTCSIPTRRKYKFDAKSTEYSVEMLFSKDIEVRAKAKLNLSAQLEASIHREVIRNPALVLSVVLAEACLSPEEVVGMLFQKDKTGEHRVCVHCKTCVTLSQLTYHPKCPVVQWLIQRSHYCYDTQEKALCHKKKTWISPRQRSRLVELLKIHAALRCDIVFRTATETVIWIRQEDGTLRRVQVTNTKPEDVVGSYAWRKKHGISS